MEAPVRVDTARGLRGVLVPLALAQFICSFAGSNMNVMITDISEDLDTTVQGVQIAITVFLLVMAALMIPGGKLTDRWGRKRCFTARPHHLRDRRADERGLAGPRGAHPRQLDPRGRRHRAADPARLHPHHDAVHRHHVAGPGVRRDQRHGRHRRGGRAADRRPHHHRHQLAGGVRLPGPGRRRSSSCSAGASRTRCRARPDPPLRHRRRGPVGRRPRPGRDGHPRRRQQPLADARSSGRRRARPRRGSSSASGAKERAGEEPLLSTERCSATAPRTSGSSRRTSQWLLLLGTSFVVSAYLQVVRGYNAIETGVIFTAATVGILVSSLAAERLAKRYAAAHPDHRRLRHHASPASASCSPW